MLSDKYPYVRYCLAQKAKSRMIQPVRPGRISSQVLMSTSPNSGRVMRGLSSRPIQKSYIRLPVLPRPISEFWVARLHAKTRNIDVYADSVGQDDVGSQQLEVVIRNIGPDNKVSALKIGASGQNGKLNSRGT